MLLKKYVIPVFISFFVFAGTAAGCPVYAQDNSNQDGGFFGGIGKFFTRMWSGDVEKTAVKPQAVMQKREQKQEATEPAIANKKLMKDKLATGEGRLVPGEEGRLSGLVAQGKITEAQKTAIIAKMKALQEELKAWAKREGIDPQYVMMPGGGPLTNQTTNKEGSPSGKMKPGSKPTNTKMQAPQR